MRRSVLPRNSFIWRYKTLALLLFFTAIALALDIAGSNHHVLRVDGHVILAAESLVVSCILIGNIGRDIRAGIYGVDILAVTAIITAVILREYWAAAITSIMVIGGESLEQYGSNRARADLDKLLKIAPQTAIILRGKKEFEIPVGQVRPRDRLVIKPGSVVPVDCQVLDGSSFVDESSITGESLPVAKDKGDGLLSGSINNDGLLTVIALRKAEDSQFEQIIKLVKRASTVKAPFVRMADRFALPFTVFAFALAGAAWFFSGEADRFLKVLVVATPCPLILAAPIALVSGVGRAARHGIIFKTGQALERLSQVKSVAFDKTGTLTLGEPKVKKIETAANIKSSRVLAVAAGLEADSNHILAKAITAEAKKQGVKWPRARGLDEIAGHGVEALLGRHKAMAGRLKYLTDSGVSVPKSFKANGTNTAVYVAEDNEFLGAIYFEDQLRDDANQMLDRLQDAGIKYQILISGDNHKAVESVAKKLGIEEYYADCLPAQKVEAIEGIPKKYRPIAFAGDGINDAPALAAADVGIALGAKGVPAASEAAEAVIMQGSISKVASALEIADRTMNIARQSVVVGIVLSIALMGIFATGKFRAASGAVIQEILDVIVILNALRAHRTGPLPKNMKVKLAKKPTYSKARS